MVQPTAREPGETLLDGKLEVVRVLGTGGMGTVYEVKHTLTKHHRALKVMHPRETNATIIKRFLQEASVAGTLGSEYIVETFDAGQLGDGSFYVLMEMLEGEPLRHVLDRLGKLDPGVACAIAEELCRGLAVAHEKGIIHRDLKPDNVFLVDGPLGIRVKLLDFGISKFSESESVTAQTKTGAILGTPLYMSPEQLKNAKDVDARTDIYAVGVMLYEMLSGTRPFDADSLPTLLVKIYTGERAPLDEVASELPAELVEIVERALELDAAKRTRSVRELETALGPFASRVRLPPRPGFVEQDTDKIAFLPTATPDEDARVVPETHAAELVSRDGRDGRDSRDSRDTESHANPRPASVEAAAPNPSNRSRSMHMLWIAIALIALGAAAWMFRSELGPRDADPLPNRDGLSMRATSVMSAMTTHSDDPLSTMTKLPPGEATPPDEATMSHEMSTETSMSMSASSRDLKQSPYSRMQ